MEARLAVTSRERDDAADALSRTMQRADRLTRENADLREFMSVINPGERES